MYGFVDKHSDTWLEQNGFNKFEPNNIITKTEERTISPAILRVENFNQNLELNAQNDLRFECLNGTF